MCSYKERVLIQQLRFYNYSTVLGAANKCKQYSETTVEIGTQLKTVKTTSIIFAVWLDNGFFDSF